MSNRKFLPNFPKNLNFRKRTDDSQEHGVSSPRNRQLSSSVTRKGSSHLSPGTDVTCSLSHSSSTGDLTCATTNYTPLLTPDNDTDGETILLGERMQRCADALISLRELISVEALQGCDDESRWDDIHRGLEEVLAALKEIIHYYPTLDTADILDRTAALITKVKDCSFNSSEDNISAVISDIDSLSTMLTNRCMQLAQNAIAEIIVVDVDQSSNLSKAKSLDCLNRSPINGRVVEPSNAIPESGEALDDVLHKLENGVEMALHRAQAWSKFAKDLVNYIEKRTNLWSEFARNLAKIAKSLQTAINEDSYLPFHSVFSTAVCQEEGMLALIVSTRNAIHSRVVIAPLNARRVEHDKIRKNLKFSWSKQLNKMHDAVNNVRKAKSLYISRQQEYDKIKEQALKAETDSQNLAASGNAAKAEKRKKQEDEALQKAVEAESAYKAGIVAANAATQQLQQVKTSILCEVRELINESDRILKLATVGYFQVMHESAITVPLQFRALCEASQLYEPGSHYMNYIRHLRPADNTPAVVDTFTFEPYMSRFREASSSFGPDSSGLQEKSSSLHLLPGDLGEKWPQVGEDNDSDVSDDSGDDLSIESSPSASPYQSHHQTLTGSASAMELANMAEDFTRIGEAVPTYRGIRLSCAAQTHMLRKLHTPSRCAECEQYVYFQGAECELCGVAIHKKCLEILRCVCEQHKPTSSRPIGIELRGVSNSEDVPYLVKKCITEIDKRGLNIKGIYRLSGVKSKVEQLCQSFETDERNVDLSEHHPNVITNVLKLYFRQLPEPLLSFDLYPDLIALAREELQGAMSCSGIIAALNRMVNSLPVHNQRTLAALIYHLNRVAKHQEENQMSSANLGIVFGPTLLRPREGASSLNYLIETPFQTRIVELLIDNVEVIFGTPEPAVDVVDSDVSDVVLRSNLGRLSTGDFQAESTSPGIGSWYAPTTKDLLQELAKEAPHFQQLQGPGAQQPQPQCTDDVMHEFENHHSQSTEHEENKIYFI